MEKISVIIPAYNAEDTVDEIVRVVLGQTYSNLVLILVNDGSTDGTASLCDGFADPRVRVFHQKNSGVSAARNLGLSQARGDYVTFLDADDVVPLDYLAVLYNACCNADIAVCDVVSIQEGCELVRFTCPNGVLTQKQALDFLLERRGINSGPCAKLFKRSILEGLRFPALKAYEDILFVREAFCQAKRIAVTDRTEYRYIQNPTGAMNRFFKDPSLDIVRATEELLAFLEKRPDLSPRCFYITVSHLMQYAMPVAQNHGRKDFVLQSRKLYRKYWWQLLTCSAFPWKEKLAYSLFALGWLYTNCSIKWIGE